LHVFMEVVLVVMHLFVTEMVGCIYWHLFGSST